MGHGMAGPVECNEVRYHRRPHSQTQHFPALPNAKMPVGVSSVGSTDQVLHGTTLSPR